MPTPISEHFTVEEMGLQGASYQQLQNARFLCEEVMEPIRAFYNSPVNVHDGYRDLVHNKAVGGVACSYHMYLDGKAAIDFDVQGFSITEVFDWIRLKSFLPLDKVIMEKNKNQTPVVIHIQTDLFNKLRQEAYVGYTGATGIKDYKRTVYMSKVIP